MRLKFSCIIKIIGLILRRIMFDVAIKFFSSVANMCKKANELIHKQQISMQVRLIRRQQRPALSQCGI